MSNIDWGKSPEGATHCCKSNYNLFYKVVGDVLLFHCDHSGWVESEYKDINDLSEEYSVIERPKQEEVDMDKQVFKVGDKVYCPHKGFGVYTVEHSNGRIFPLGVVNSTYTMTGQMTGQMTGLDAVTCLFHATPENKALLEQLYRTEFESLPVKLSGSELTRAKLKEFGKPILCWVSDSSDDCAISTKRVVLIVTSEESGHLRFITSAGIPYHHAVPYTGGDFLTGKDFE